MAKRRAERAIADLNVRTRVLQPGALYGKGQPHFQWIVTQGFRLLDKVNPISEQMGDARPLAIEPVARAALAAADVDQNPCLMFSERSASILTPFVVRAAS